MSVFFFFFDDRRRVDIEEVHYSLMIMMIVTHMIHSLSYFSCFSFFTFFVPQRLLIFHEKHEEKHLSIVKIFFALSWVWISKLKRCKNEKIWWKKKSFFNDIFFILMCLGRFLSTRVIFEAEENSSNVSECTKNVWKVNLKRE